MNVKKKNECNVGLYREQEKEMGEMELRVLQWHRIKSLWQWRKEEKDR